MSYRLTIKRKCMKLIINNVEFPFDFGCRVLKLKHKECPYSEISDFWDDIKPANFIDICKLVNLEQRRVGILHLGINKIISSVRPTLVSSVTIPKSTTWVNSDGEVEVHSYDDVYELYKVDGKHFSDGLESWRKADDCHYVRCKDTSTDREYLIWVDVKSIARTNNIMVGNVNAIHAIAWTIQTDVPQGNIKEIIRQGDCILIKPSGKYEPLLTPRHLTRKEYLDLMVAES